MKTIYKEIILSKNNLEIPIFESGNLANSKYNPLQEAENFIKQVEEADIYLILGLAGAFHVKYLLNKFPNAKILVIENSNKDIFFLKNKCKIVSELINNKDIIIFPKEQIKSKLLENYLPSMYPTLSILELRSWVNEEKDQINTIREEISNILEIIKSDFATQAEFGKIWQHNILKNLSFLNSDIKIDIPLSKTAIIVAAGPSLDSKIDEIKNNRNNLFIISTDTAYYSLKKRKIFSDVVISIDGQLISKNHFFCQKEDDTIFIFDICANPIAVREVAKNNNKILFSTTGHPLALFTEYICKKNCFMKLDAGSGTVTMSAINFAYQCGFPKIKVIGADFGYINGKAYTKGTYLDELFQISQNKINNLENKFCSLMFKFLLEKVNNLKKTSKLLNSYKISFEELMKKNNLFFKYENDIYIIELNDNKNNSKVINLQSINKQLIKNFSIKITEESFVTEENSFVKIFEMALLPYIAYLRKKYSSYIKSYIELRKLALDDFVMYTKEI